MESDSVEGSQAPQSTGNSVQLIIGGSNQPDQTSSQHEPQSATSPQHESQSTTSPQHESQSATSPEHGSESPPTNPQPEPISTARDIVRPSSLPTKDTDLGTISSPVVIKHPYMDLVDSGSSAPNSPTPEKALKKKAKKKKRHSSKSSSKSSPLVGSGSSHVGVMSPLTNQIGPAVTSGGPNFPSMSQLVSEISSLNNPAGDGTASGHVTSSSQIDTEMMQIDSILRALNTGTFDDGNMATIQQLTAQRPQNVISTVQKSPGLALIGQLGSDDDDDDDDSSSSDSGLSSSDEEEEDSAVIDEADEEEEAGKKGLTSKPHGYPMVKGEVDYRDLPPVEEFSEVCPPSASLSAVGKISHTAEKLIIIEANDNTPPLDEGSVLWTADRQPVGKLFETFGPVKKPFYSVRLTESGASCPPPAGTDVFVIMGTSEMTKYIFTDQLLKMQGSDASWLNDNEVPEELQDFSDDEKEQAAHRKKKEQHQSDASLHSAQPSKPKPRRGRKVQHTSTHHYSGQHQVYATSSQQPPNAQSFSGVNNHTVYSSPHPPFYGPSSSGQFYPPPPLPPPPAWSLNPPPMTSYAAPAAPYPPPPGQPPHLYSWVPQGPTGQPPPPPMWCHNSQQPFPGLPPNFP